MISKLLEKFFGKKEEVPEVPTIPPFLLHKLSKYTINCEETPLAIEVRESFIRALEDMALVEYYCPLSPGRYVLDPISNTVARRYKERDAYNLLESLHTVSAEYMYNVHIILESCLDDNYDSIRDLILEAEDANIPMCIGDITYFEVLVEDHKMYITSFSTK